MAKFQTNFALKNRIAEAKATIETITKTLEIEDRLIASKSRLNSTLSYFIPAPLESVWREIPWPFASDNAGYR
jgi:hypothetical protein